MVLAQSNPPWCLVGRVLSREESTSSSNSCGSSVEGTAMVSSTAGNVINFLRQLPCNWHMFQESSHGIQMEFLPQLAMWPISGRSLEVQTFQTKLKNSSLHPGGVKHRDLIIPSSRNGALNGAIIPFQDPLLM